MELELFLFVNWIRDLSSCMCFSPALSLSSSSDDCYSYVMIGWVPRQDLQHLRLTYSYHRRQSLGECSGVCEGRTGVSVLKGGESDLPRRRFFVLIIVWWSINLSSFLSCFAADGSFLIGWFGKWGSIKRGRRWIRVIEMMKVVFELVSISAQEQYERQTQ